MTTMRVLTCTVWFLLFCQSSLGSRVTFQATPSNVYPVITQTLQLRCAVQHNVRIVKRQITPTTTTTPRITQQPTTVSTVGAIYTTPTYSTSAGTTPRTYPTPTYLPTFTEVEVSHIVSIIVSRTNTNTGRQEKVASLSSFDPPTAYTDFDKITVSGHSDSSSIPGELGYLDVTWRNPVSDQSGIYTCEIYALDSTLHPVSTTEVVHITATEPTSSQLVSIIAQNNQYITELSHTVSELRNQTARLQSQSQLNALALRNLTESIQRNDTTAQNIQTGSLSCYYYGEFVRFERPYNNEPEIFVALGGVDTRYSSTINVTVSWASLTGFQTQCSSSQGTLTTYWNWISIGN